MHKIFTFMSLLLAASSPALHTETLKVYDKQSISNTRLGCLLCGVGILGTYISIQQICQAYELGDWSEEGRRREQEVEKNIANIAQNIKDPEKRAKAIWVEAMTTPCNFKNPAQPLLGLSVVGGIGSCLTIIAGAHLMDQKKPILTLSEENKFLCYQGITVSFDNITHIKQCKSTLLIHTSPEAEIPGNIIVIDTKKLDIKMHKLIRTLKELLETNKTNDVIFSRGHA